MRIFLPLIYKIVLFLSLLFTLLSSCALPLTHRRITKSVIGHNTTIIEGDCITIQKSSRPRMRLTVLCPGADLPLILLQPNTIYEISQDFDLLGAIVTIGSDSVLEFNGGSLSNGTLIGDKTEITGVLNNIFDSIRFEGTWNVPYITTNMWQSLDYPNSLCDVFSLQSPEIYNRLVIEDNMYDYNIVAPAKGGALSVLDNIELIINGNIVLEPNGYNIYEMINVSRCNNVKISGYGSLTGDRLTHDYKTITSSHEWGYGFVFRSSHNIDISGLTIQNLTGDAICIMDNCSNFNIHDLKLRDCRRCGISIRADHDIIVDNCSITGIINDQYNKPSAAIDIEPVVACEVYNIEIKNCYLSNNVRGISSNAHGHYGDSFVRNGKTETEERHYVNLEISNCHFDNSTYTSFIVPMGWESVIIKKCTFHNGRQDDIRVGYTKKCVIQNCITTCDEDMLKSMSRSFVTNQFQNASIMVDRCMGDNVRRIFSDEKNCRISRSNFIKH